MAMVSDRPRRCGVGLPPEPPDNEGLYKKMKRLDVLVRSIGALERRRRAEPCDPRPWQIVSGASSGFQSVRGSFLAAILGASGTVGCLYHAAERPVR